MATSSRTHTDYTVGWICALPKERTAATFMLDSRHPNLPKPRDDHNTYTLGSIGRHNVVIACLPKGKTGTEPAAVAVTRMLSTFTSVRFGLMVGTAGGIPHKDKVRLGDVVVSVPFDQYPGVVQWDLGKAIAGGRFKRTGALNNPPMQLLTALSKLETDHEMKGSKIPEYLDVFRKENPRIGAKYLKSNLLKDELFKSSCHHVVDERGNLESDIPESKTSDKDQEEENEEEEEEPQKDNCQYCDRTKIIKRKPRDMCVHYGLIASGNQIIKDAAVRDRINSDLGGEVLCIETEAAGIMNNLPCIVIRGICNYADSHKNKSWTAHAAAVAAAYAKELLAYVQQDEGGRQPAVQTVKGT
ncbi:nucleoside phosphorylase domain-containing protein [Biscogniauxia mediterranea]|nr:nucleoside phosphorylase domain-containing protein [Biscogniauxia mediterranea]